MKQYQYTSYAEYVECQKSANKKKSLNVWAVEENIKAIAEYIGSANFGICHGTRGGYEQAWFKKYIPGCTVWGTEIGDASAPDTIQWDFNKPHPDLDRNVDFIYSNSFDHAFNPAETLQVWANQVSSGGFIILEYDQRQEHTGEVSKSVNKTDPTSITVDELVEIVPKWIDGEVVDILDTPVVKIGFQKAVVIKINHKEKGEQL